MILTNQQISEIFDEVYKVERRREKRMDSIKKIFGRRRKKRL